MKLRLFRGSTFVAQNARWLQVQAKNWNNMEGV